MSQASKALKEIAASEEYKSLVQAMETADYEAIQKSYLRLGELLEEKKKQVLEKIQTLPRQNKDEDIQQFQNAFTMRLSGALPKWHWLDTMIKEQKVWEGEVFGFGTKGDPLVRTPAGRVVVVRGATLEKGARVRFKVVAEGEKIDFGRVFELTPDFFYFLLNQETIARIRSAIDTIEERVKAQSVTPGEDGLAEMSAVLKELEDIREMSRTLQTVEREKLESRITAHRRRLLGDRGARLATEFMAKEEEREIAETCAGDHDKAAKALAVPGLFRQPAHEALKAQLFAGEELKGYAEALAGLESRLDSMDAALKLMEFKSGVDDLRPQVRSYIEKMDRLFDRLQRKARSVAFAMAEDKVSQVGDVMQSIKNAFSGEALAAELGRVFRSPGEFFALRETLTKLRALLGDSTIQASEAAIRPYLNRKLSQAFASIRQKSPV
ncbi:MAG: hypothetical protein HY670_10125 [Chloroflexi bacterium]|nr:hypothetical protein [Chloroflexota bacterium]